GGLLKRGTTKEVPAVVAAAGAVHLKTLPQFSGAVEFRDITFAYPTRPDVPILQHFNLSIPAGRHIALVGGSGSGKSTLAALLTRFYEPRAGVVHFDGVPGCELDPSWLRSRIGYVNQDPVLFSASIAEYVCTPCSVSRPAAACSRGLRPLACACACTCACRNIRYGKPEATDEEVQQAARRAHVHDVITAFPQGYQTMVGERGVQLSGGSCLPPWQEGAHAPTHCTEHALHSAAPGVLHTRHPALPILQVSDSALHSHARC
ncbi:ATP-binding cassette domain-containing protein, partial [archaeon]